MFYYYLKFETVAFRPLEKKARTLIQAFPESRIFIGGDSIAEEGVDPRLIHSDAINLAIAGGGMVGFEKAITIFRPQKLNSKDVLIINLSIINLNESIISGDLYINQSDTFLDIGLLYLLKTWRWSFLNKFLALVQCHFSSCPYTQDSATSDQIFNQTITQKGYLSSQRVIGKNSVDVFRKQYKKFYDEKFQHDGAIFKSFKENLASLALKKAKIVIVLMPISDSFKDNITTFGTSENLQSFLKSIIDECKQYVSCTTFDYTNWDNHQLGKSINTDLYFSDFMHLNLAGSQAFSRIFKIDLEKSSIL